MSSHRGDRIDPTDNPLSTPAHRRPIRTAQPGRCFLVARGRAQFRPALLAVGAAAVVCGGSHALGAEARGVATGAAGTLGVQPAASADSSTEAMPDVSLPPFHLRASASVWLPSLGGNLEIGGANNIDLETEFGLDDNEVVPGVEVFLEFPETSRLSRWRFGLTAWDYDAESTDTLGRDLTFGDLVAPAGTDLRSDLGITSVHLSAGYDLFGDLTGDDRDPGDLRILALAGVRGLNFDHRLADVAGGPGLGGTSYVDYDEWVTAVEVGAMMDLHVAPDDLVLPGAFDVRTSLLGGIGLLGDTDVTTFAIEAAITWRPTEHLGVTFGYRHLDFSVEDDDVEPAYHFTDARLAGVFFNAVFEF